MRSDVLQFSGFTNIVSILFYNFIEFIVLLYTFLVISFAPHKEYMVCLISVRKFSDVLPAFTCARAIGNLRSICFGVNILVCLRLETIRSETLAKCKGSTLPFCFFIKFQNFFINFEYFTCIFIFSDFFVLISYFI